MVKALTVGLCVATGILIGRIQVMQNHDANAAIAAAKRADKRADEARLDAIRTRVLLDRNERKIVTMWRQLEPMLEDFTYASNPVDRDVARRKIQSLQWEMEALDAAITAIHDVAEPDLRTAYLK
jgi:hypothetical protein